MHERPPRLREPSPSAAGASREAPRDVVKRWLRRIALAARTRRTFAIAPVAGLFLAVLAPFNTSISGLGVRVLYWEGLVILCSALGVGATLAVDAVFDREGRRPLLVAVGAALLMTGPSTLLVRWASQLAFGRAASGDLLGYAPPVLLLCLALCLVNALADRRPLTSHGSAQGGALVLEPPARFLERLPLKLKGGAIYAVKAEDHYLRVHTSLGSDLVLMRLSDAVAELEGLEGTQTHRSWWVAKAAVLGVERRDGRAILRLPDGLQAPVSRNFAKALRTAGWLD